MRAKMRYCWGDGGKGGASKQKIFLLEDNFLSILLNLEINPKHENL